MAPILVTRGLTRHFGTLTAVDALDLDLAPGEILALLGPNGAGKTTAMRLVMGQLAPHGGVATIAGHHCFTERPACMRLIGYLPDEPVYHDHLSGRELCRFVAALHRLPAATAGERIGAWAERLELTDDLDEYAMNYSLGMRKKLGLILALIGSPRLLILDEPASGLDPFATRRLHEILTGFAAQGGAVLHSTHLLDQAERLCTRVAIIAHGRKVADGTLDELRAQAGSAGGLEQLFFSLAGGEAAPAATP
jgi:ABC-2 type transport system ATP-binding protein